MPASDQPPGLSGLTECFTDFSGTYCVRKLVQLVVSVLLLAIGLGVMSLFIFKYKAAKPYWLISIQSLLVLTLIANILFCFFNDEYWLYAIQNFFFNTYYLILVSYVCFAYILKQKSQVPNQPIARLEHRLNQENNGINTQKIIFFTVIAVLLAVYFAIFIVSVVFEIQHQNNQFSGDPSTNYCEETWYLVFSVFCIVLSIVVVVIMLKGQQQEYKLLLKYNQNPKQQISSGSQNNSVRAETSKSVLHVPLMKKPQKLLNKNINNPFKNLWIWVGLNAICQICNLVQSGLYINATPPQCLIIPANPSGSNILSLVFVFITMYLGFGTTLWYIILVKLLRDKAAIDRSILFSQQVRAGGNIELFVPSRQQTVVTLI